MLVELSQAQVEGERRRGEGDEREGRWRRGGAGAKVERRRRTRTGKNCWNNPICCLLQVDPIFLNICDDFLGRREGEAGSVDVGVFDGRR